MDQCDEKEGKRGEARKFFYPAHEVLTKKPK